MNTQEREQLMHELKVITLLSAEEIENFRIVNSIKLTELKTFYLRSCRLPTTKECESIKLVGFDAMMFFTEKPPGIFDKVIAALTDLKSYDYEPRYAVLLNPKDYKQLSVNKISINFMRIIKRNRKLRYNGK